MTDFKDFLNQVKIRLTNPLIFSFLVSWTIINWRVILGSFYLNENSLDKLGYSNYLDFISGTIDWANGVCYPVLSAIIYTIVSPILRLSIQLFNTWINKIGNNQIRKVAKESFIQYEIYDQLLEELQVQRKRNEDMLNENVLLSNQLSDLKSKYLDEKNNADSIKSTNQELTTRYVKTFDKSILNGKWKRTVKYGPDSNQIDEVLINSSNIDIRQSSKGYYTNTTFQISFLTNTSLYLLLKKQSIKTN
jgi:hypothetical protein